MLAKDGVKHNSIYVYMFIPVIAKKKKTTQASAWVKTQKLCHNCPIIYLFFWEREGKPYTSNPIVKTFKILKCAFQPTITMH